ncbi:MAG: precorrin-8X methylmutase, partial [Desulfonatronovibrio sp.]
MKKQGIIILAHGSRNKDAGKAFLRMVDVLGKRIGDEVVPAFFSLGSPDLGEAVAGLAAEGCTSLVIFPYFLFDGNHVRKDIPSMVQDLEEKYPEIEFRILGSLEHEALMPEIVYERIWEHSTHYKYFAGPDIEKSSLDFIHEMLGTELDQDQKSVAARVVHASADFSLGRSLRFHPEAIRAGLDCLQAGKQVICDVNMVRSALSGCDNVLCAIDQPGADREAITQGTTRSAAGMELLADRLEDSMVIIGNAPTALWKVLDLAEHKGIVPALIVGVPVGFVGAAQAKEALMKSGIIHISNVGPKGGSPVAGAVVNALMRL